MEFNLTVRGHLNLRPQVPPGEQFVYTVDGSIPNKFTSKEPQSDLIYIQKNTNLRIRSYKVGMVDSPILTYKITVVERVEGDLDGIGNMKRQTEIVIEDEEIDAGFEDLFGGAGFSSFHDQGILTTPNML